MSEETLKVFTDKKEHPRKPGQFVLNYTEEYRKLFSIAYGNDSTDPITRANARVAINKELDKVINIIRPTQDIYLQSLAEIESVPSEVLPTYYLRERTGTDVEYFNTQDQSLQRVRVIPGQKFSILPEQYTDTATWARFDFWSDLNPRDESLAQLKLSLDVARAKDFWTLARLSIANGGYSITDQAANAFSIAKWRKLTDHFVNHGYGNMLKQVVILMNTEARRDLEADCISNQYPIASLFAEVGAVHLVPSVASTKNQYGIYIPAESSGDATRNRVYAFLPNDYSREFVVQTGGTDLYVEDYIPQNAGWELGVKAMLRISRLIVDRVKGVYLDYSAT